VGQEIVTSLLLGQKVIDKTTLADCKLVVASRPSAKPSAGNTTVAHYKAALHAALDKEIDSTQAMLAANSVVTGGGSAAE
jgi:hypothetical protein